MTPSVNSITFSKTYPGLFLEEAIRHENFSMSRRHFHESMELYFLLEGERFYFVEQDTYRISSHTAMLVGRNRIHKTSTVSNNPYHKRFLLQFDAAVFDPLLEAMGLPAMDEIEKNYAAVASFSDQDWDLICHLIEHLKALCSQPDPMAESMIRFHAVELLSLFLRNRSSYQTLRYKRSDSDLLVHTGVHQKVHEVARFLQQNCTDKISLDELASRFYLSRSYLTRIFRSITGFTVTEYQTFCRLQKAQLLLTDTDLSITEIASQTGFGNVTYFERVFKSSTGNTPLSYRRNHNI